MLSCKNILAQTSSWCYFFLRIDLVQTLEERYSIHRYYPLYQATHHITVSQISSWFLRVCRTSHLKTVLEKEKLLITSNFSFSHSVFYPIWELSVIFIKLQIVVCKLSIWKQSEICHLGTGLLWCSVHGLEVEHLPRNHEFLSSIPGRGVNFRIFIGPFGVSTGVVPRKQNREKLV